MKYVILENIITDHKLAMVFDDALVHSLVVNTLLQLQETLRVRSAGFVKKPVNGVCETYGMSESLGVGTHPDDSIILSLFSAGMNSLEVQNYLAFLEIKQWKNGSETSN